MRLKIDKLGMNGEGVARPLRDNDIIDKIGEKKDYKVNNLGVNKIGTDKENAYNESENINSDLQKVTFVDFALPNEIIEAEVVQEKSKFCNARLKQVIESSIDRVVAPCPYFAKCGGCNLQHLKYGKK